jgi:metallophosphoesterase (TIGR03767 family)
MSTVDRTVVPGEVRGVGTRGEYRVLAPGPGEPHQTRTDLTPAATAASAAKTFAETAVETASETPDGQPFLRFAHLTDFQLADPSSPGRLDFLQPHADRPGWAGMFPAYRPQEFVAPHGVEAMIRTLADQQPLDFVLTTGDNTDNAQSNELAAVLALLDGGADLDPLFGEPDATGNPAHTPSGHHYHPEPGSDDVYQREHGFPTVPGALAAAAKPFRTHGLGAPWLACCGNHDCLAQGRSRVTPQFQALVTGDRRPVAAPADLPAEPMSRYLTDPTALSRGASVPITPRADRRLLDRAEYVRAHLASPTSPRGHGFTDRNLADDTAHYCYDEVPGVRVIVLDTTNPDGDVTGSIGQRQRDWLVDRLTEVHSRYRRADGTEVRTDTPDRAVILASHHGLAMLDNDRVAPDADPPRHLAGQLTELLHRFPNVVLWLAGHEHRNAVTPVPGPAGGFWHVLTSGLCEWPCQSRLLELRVTDTDRLVIRSTMIDHAAPTRPGPALDLWDLAALHRELAANEPTRVGGPHSAGTPADRNVDLTVPITPALATTLRALRDPVSSRR